MEYLPLIQVAVSVATLLLVATDLWVDVRWQRPVKRAKIFDEACIKGIAFADKADEHNSRQGKNTFKGPLKMKEAMNYATNILAEQQIVVARAKIARRIEELLSRKG